MASIIDKAFDASKKIVRTVFRGAPNLFTTSDINRQFEAIKAQLDFLEDKVGCVNTSNVDVIATISETTLTVKVQAGGGGSMEFYVRGIKHTATSFSALTKTSIGKSGVCYLVMKAKTKLVEFSDAQYDISGAEFSDGTYQPAADHLVYDTFSLSLESSNILPAGAIGVLAKISWEGTTTYVRPYYKNSVYTNGIHSDSGLFAMAQNRIEDINTKETTKPGVNVSYDSVISYLSRTIVPVGTILPFYGDVKAATLSYGWIPCTALAYVGTTSGVTVSSFASENIYKLYNALYGTDIEWGVYADTEAGKTFLYVKKCKGVEVPYLSGRFLVGAGAYNDPSKGTYSLGVAGGENKHTLTESELAAHDHQTMTSGSHVHEIKHVTNEKGTGNETVNTNKWNVDGADPKKCYPTGYTSSGGTHVMGITIEAGYGNTWIGNNWIEFQSAGGHSHTVKDAGGDTAHENRPPYRAVYYIMRVV